MIYEADTMFDCIIMVSIYDKQQNQITKKELQSKYSAKYRGDSIAQLIKNIKEGTKNFIESNTLQHGNGWSEKFLGVNEWEYVEVDVDLLNKPEIYENEEEADNMHFLVKRAYRYCENLNLDTEFYPRYFNVYFEKFKYRIQMAESIYLKVEKIIQECLPYYSKVTYVDNPKDVPNVITNFEKWINR